VSPLQQSPYGAPGALSGMITLVMLSSSEQKIQYLCSKVVELRHDSPEFELDIQEPKAAIHEHLTEARENIKILRLAVVRSQNSEAAD
jgi:hypothetical protein